MRGIIIQINASLSGGLPKRAIPDANVTPLGLEGDSQAHPQFHGGARQAILIISSEDLDALREQGFTVFPGALGENFTTRGLDFRHIRAGQRFRAGDAIIEITKPRSPCHQLDPYGAGIQKAVFEPGIKKGDTTSPHWGKAGFYASVTQTGSVRTNDIIELLDQVV